ncbi:hypothetical protein [Aliiroseovarius sp. YM-037]|uniref:hypothetical protein n=1 Tax=Aliiroseovarius sp. YM-037 TaxID=3341728 RepID=UPI003A812E1B
MIAKLNLVGVLALFATAATAQEAAPCVSPATGAVLPADECLNLPDQTQATNFVGGLAPAALAGSGAIAALAGASSTNNTTSTTGTTAQ